MDEAVKVATYAIEKNSEELHKLSQEIWSKPELNYEEFHAHKVLTDYLEETGFNVLRKTPIDTSFIARFGNGSDGPKIGVMCEYDALPGIGHACGHNLIAEAGVAAGLGIKAVLEANPNLKGEVIVFGTPAEEGGGGKIKMIHKGSFDECDICMMVHPAPMDMIAPICLSICQIGIIFTGKASHAALAPWEGVNALDAAVATYANVSMLRQQMKPTCRVHGIIVDGGEKPNIIPRRSEMNFYMRGITDADAHNLRDRVMDCAKAAALATGCTAEFNTTEACYKSLLSNSVVEKLYSKYATSLGVKFEANQELGSTDMGDVSKIKPSIHPCFAIKCDAPNHSPEFTQGAGALENQTPTLNAGKAMAFAGIELILNPLLIKEAEKEFHRDIKNY